MPLASGEHALTYVTQAPPVFFGWRPSLVAATLLSPAATASLVYAVIAAGTARDDLGRCPAGEPASNAPMSEAGVA
ncbi:hypothetical protein BZL29_3285 [Mycobacterium kansasii]|uniref:Uncharacterized protein n=1 Tax=Mycobacterium kansasii TaxID=1768 RepID=A0A1V3XE39_MYCKA|nr:hypothetical protein BZL29_3285 [Mycobacterium kansasii]